MPSPFNVNDYLQFEPDGDNLYFTYCGKRFRLYNVNAHVQYDRGFMDRVLLEIEAYPAAIPPKKKPKRKMSDLGLRRPK